MLSLSHKMEDIDLHGLGEFTSDVSGFRIKRYHLEEPWSYIYATDNILLKVDQRGPDYVQFSPPGGTVFFRRERFDLHPSCFVWIKTGENRAFSNFYRPLIGYAQAYKEPDEFYCDFRPDRALYHVANDGISCDTELFIPPDEAVIVMTCRVTNTGLKNRDIELIPVMRPHFASASLEPWDLPALYQKVSYSNEQFPLFSLELRSPAGNPSERQHAFVLADVDSPDGAEVSYARFVGNGTFEDPDALRNMADGTVSKSIDCFQGVVALQKRISLAPGESYAFTQVAGMASTESEDILSYSRYFDQQSRKETCSVILGDFQDFASRRSISTPDPAFDRYVNEWLPLQIKWVKTLDRGWPTGMRGVRDHAQDMTGLIPLDPQSCRRAILELFSFQRTDGWFLRQYSTKGKHGKHDLRDYVDSGAWVWELLHDYLCYTKDFDILQEELGWLDSDDTSSLRSHVTALIDYYLNPANLGEHGLCLIRGGDWNDAINGAGLEGRGETVMASCQVVLMLRQASAIFNNPEYADHAEKMKQSLLKYALNNNGYLNGVFTDNGEWVFSSDDPDGVSRVNVPVNAFGIISGVLSGEDCARAMQVLVDMKQQDGWPLFFPPMGNPPIHKLGRIGQGDLAAGHYENGAMYNHGCHGFLARAAAVAGDGDLLFDVLKYMLPYDQNAHPVDRSKTAPYGVVNHWKTAAGAEGRGGSLFLSGSISTALRDVYNGLFGITPVPGGIGLKPVLPSAWNEASVKLHYRGANLEIVYKRSSANAVFVDGKEVDTKARDSVTGKELIVIPDEVFEPGKSYQIDYLMMENSCLG